MTDPTDDAVPQGLADLHLDERRARDVQAYQELNDGLTRRHVTNAAFARSYFAVQLARLRRMGKREG